MLISEQGLLYSLSGQGPAVLLLHGFLEDHSMWSFLDDLSENHTVLAVDLPGHGNSPLLEEPQRMDGMAKSVLALLNECSIEQCAVVGHSMGGYVALEMAIQQPQCIVGISLFHSNPFADSTPKKKDRAKAARVVERNLAVFVEAAIPNLFTLKNQKKLAATIEELIENANTLSPKSVAACLLGMRERSCAQKWLLSTDIPALIVAGKQDVIMPYKALENLFSKSDKIEGVVLENVGHMGHLEAPKLCCSIYKKWLTTVFALDPN